MTKINFAEEIQVVPLLASIDIVASATSSNYLNMDVVAGMVEFEVLFGAIAATDSTGSVVVTIAGASDTVTDTSPTALAFQYRLSSAVGTDALGAITAATTSGVTQLSTQDNMILLCYVDPAALGDLYKFVRVTLTPADAPTSTPVSVVARFVPRYAQNAMISSS